MYYIVRVWDGNTLMYEQEFPPELPDNEIKARSNYEKMEELWPEYHVTLVSQSVSLYKDERNES